MLYFITGYEILQREDTTEMNFLEERILKDGIVKEGNVLKVDSFLNHQMDITLFNQMGEEFKKDLQISQSIKY